MFVCLFPNFSEKSKLIELTFFGEATLFSNIALLFRNGKKIQKQNIELPFLITSWLVATLSNLEEGGKEVSF